MASRKTKSIDEMDMEECFDNMKALGVSVKGLKTLDEMRSRLRTALNPVEETSSWSARQVRVFFSKISERTNFGLF